MVEQALVSLGLNNREISFLSWIVIFLIGFMINSDIRKSLLLLVKSFFAKQLFICHILMGSYLAVQTYGLQIVGFWEGWMLKDTIVWALFSGFILLFRFAQTDREKPLSIKAVLLDNLKLVVLFEFLVNLTSFDLWVELLLLPVILSIVLLIEVSKLNKEHHQVGKFFEWVQGIIGLAILYFSVKEIASNSEQHLKLETLLSFLLPLVMTVTFVPFVYLAGIYSRYEIVFMRLGIWNKDKNLNRSAKWLIFKSCLLNLSKIDKLSTPVGVPVFQARSTDEIKAELLKINQ